MKRRNSISGQFAARLIEMLESPAYRALSASGHMVISRIEIELGHHAGNDNGRLPVTSKDFTAYGVHPESVAPAIREAEALGFIRVTERGRGGNAEHHKLNMFCLTFAHNRESRAAPPTHDWRRIKTIAEAKQIARAARAAKDPSAVRRGKQTAKKTKHRPRNPGVGPTPKTGDGNTKTPTPESGDTGSPRNPGILSISGAGGRNGRPKRTEQVS